MLSADFDLEEEVPGTWPLDGRMCYLDFMAIPRQHLVEAGFDAPHVGIEVKSPISKESVKKLLDCVLQSYTYSLCEFSGRRLSFVLVYPEPSQFFEYDRHHKYRESGGTTYTAEEVRLLRRLMERANVGELRSTKHRYEIHFAANRYFDPVRGRTKIRNLGITRRIGSQKVRK